MACSPDRLQRTHDELELVVLCLECLLKGRPALGEREKQQFRKTLDLARREIRRLWECISGGAAHADIPSILALLTDETGDPDGSEAEEDR